METLEDGTPITLDMIRECIKKNPPGQGVLHMHIEEMFVAPFYIAYLLERLERAERRWWLKLGGFLTMPFRRL